MSFFIASPVFVSAQEKADEDSGFIMKRDKDGNPIFIQKESTVIQGTVPRPNVAFVYGDKNINYEWENLKRDFLPKIINAVKKAPF